MTGRSGWFAGSLLIAAMTSGISGLAQANPHTCTLATLDDLYVFTGTGYTSVSPGPPQPKAIVELIRFNGDGTLDVPGGTVSVNGHAFPATGTGTYTVGSLAPPDKGCVGSLAFTDGPHFNLFFPLDGRKIQMIQTDQNNVLQGTATRVSP